MRAIEPDGLPELPEGWDWERRQIVLLDAHGPDVAGYGLGVRTTRDLDTGEWARASLLINGHMDGERKNTQRGELLAQIGVAASIADAWDAILRGEEELV